ncbi:type VI secretion system baseplate subunit TssF [Escherichia coli]|nr:type VI secretion system baseplate subunit TssF [Escherichia coli]
MINGLESEYLLRPKRLQDGYTEIYSVDAVAGSGRTGSAEYVPFTSFRHRGECCAMMHPNVIIIPG